MKQRRKSAAEPASRDPQRRQGTAGFTLIELSVVLVIIGLIVGGILYGVDMIKAAAVRSQVSQIEKFNTAVNTFMNKCGGLPRDISAQGASACGLQPRGQYAGEGDGNGVIEGVSGGVAGANSSTWECAGETAMFWVDLSTAGLIEGNFNTASSTIAPGTISGTTLNLYFPQAKVGEGNYIFVYSKSGTNYFELQQIGDIFEGYDMGYDGLSGPT
jgi:prepilin-type N-terminal cleavage/methylation domain-containing protein